MDLERIKQNLRLRSGRSKKNRKAQAPPSSQQPLPAAVAPNGSIAKDPAPAAPKPESEKTESKQQEASDKTPEQPPSSDQVPQHQPELPYAATGRQEESLDLETGQERYGRSGIEKPKTRPSEPQRRMSEPMKTSSDTDTGDYDLRPPAPRSKPLSLEAISELLFSAGHLNALLHEPQSIARFTAFLNRYKPEFQPLIVRYLETQKAIKAVEYANAVAEGAATEKDGLDNSPTAAAVLDKSFEEASATAFTSLVGAALPMYITYTLVKLVSECLVNEITGKQTPLMRNLVGGLSEVFCISDPTQDDNPIVYASEEFYRYTGYASEDVIGHNCRFLQGRKTNRDSPRRLKEATQKGDEHCETLLNYRRDGRPFINLLMIAPLHDNKGKVRYHIGAQVDVTGLVEGGRALDGFERYLQHKENERQEKRNQGHTNSKEKSKALKKLQELSEMFDLEESAAVQSRSRASSTTRDDDSHSVGGSDRRQRRVFVDTDASDQDMSGDSDDEQKEDSEAWKLGQQGPHGLSGKLPGVYDTYMLIRAAPSLRIIFVSPKLRRLGNIVQSPFLAHVAAPAPTLSGLKESFNTGAPVTAKINMMAKAGDSRDGTKTAAGTKLEEGKYGRTCWISATPLFGSDEKIGVWMIVLVEKAKAKRTTRAAEVEEKVKQSNSRQQRPTRIEMPKRAPSKKPEQQQPEEAEVSKEELPIKPKRLDDLTNHVDEEESHSGTQTPKAGTPTRSEEDQKPVQPQVDGVSSSPADDDHGGEDDEQFVRPKSPNAGAQANGRLHIEPDSERELNDHDEHMDHDDHEDQDSPDWQPARERSNTASPSPADQDSERKYTPPPNIPDSMQNATPPPKSPTLEVDEATPTRPRFDQDEGDDYDDADTFQPSARLDGMLPMDYLRHPGTTAGKRGGGREGDNWTDVDCLRSPYSVD